MHRLFVAFLLLSALVPAFGRSEKEYGRDWAAAHNGQVNVRSRDGTRCDVLTPTHAVEVTFASQWQDAVGRTLYQAMQLNKHAGVVLIMESEKDDVYRQRLDTMITVFNLPIDVWEVGAGAGK